MIYKCDLIPCPGSGGGYAGNILDGEVIGSSVKLRWSQPVDKAKVCVLCKPLKSFLGPVPYRQAFGSPDVFTHLNNETLPLKSGYTKTGQVKDWLKYTITLTKIK